MRPSVVISRKEIFPQRAAESFRGRGGRNRPAPREGRGWRQFYNYSFPLRRGRRNRTFASGFGGRCSTIKLFPRIFYISPNRFNNPVYAEPKSFNLFSRFIASSFLPYAS